MKWIDYYYMQQQYEKTAAVNAAKLAIASKQPVGVPEAPVFDQSLPGHPPWTSSYVNVPLSQFAPYTNSEFKQQIIASPKPDPGALQPARPGRPGRPNQQERGHFDPA